MPFNGSRDLDIEAEEAPEVKYAGRGALERLPIEARQSASGSDTVLLNM